MLRHLKPVICWSRWVGFLQKTLVEKVAPLHFIALATYTVDSDILYIHISNTKFPRGGLRALETLDFFCSSKAPTTLYCRTKRSNSLLGPLRAAYALEFAAPARSEPSKCARKRCSGSLGAADCARKCCSLETAGRDRKRWLGSLGAKVKWPKAICSPSLCNYFAVGPSSKTYLEDVVFDINVSSKTHGPN